MTLRYLVLAALFAVVLASVCTYANSPTGRESVSVEIGLALGPGQGEPTPAKLLAVAAGTASSNGEEIEIPVQVPGALRIRLKARQVWRLDLQAAGYWSPGTVIAPVAEGESLEITLFATGTITGSLELAEKTSDILPSEIKVRFISSTDDGEIPEHTGACPVEDSQWRCDVPAGTLDLRLRASGFISHYRWKTKVEAHQVHNLGRLLLMRGSSISGRIETMDGGALDESLRVEIAPISAGAPQSPEEMKRRASLASGQKVEEGGFFHLTGVAPGSYTLSAHQAGFAPAILSPLQVLPNTETEVRETLVLQRPVSLEVLVEPPTDLSEHPWKIELLAEGQYSSYLDRIAEGNASMEGRFTRQGLTPGYYILRVVDSAGSNVAQEHLELTGEDPPLRVSLNYVEVVGDLRLGDSPLQAELWFGGRNSWRRIGMQSDDQGRFAGLLPGDGLWRLDVEAQDPPVTRRIKDLEVRRPETGGAAELQIELPDTLVAGRVVDDHEQLVDVALVTMWGLEDGEVVHRRTEAGEFQFRGLGFGAYKLGAEAAIAGAAYTAEPIGVILAEDRDPGFFEVVVQQQIQISGVVSSPVGEVPGTFILARPLAGGRVLTQRFPQTTTDVRGFFRLTVPEKADYLELIISPPGYTLKASAVRLPLEGPLELQAEAYGGKLVLEFEGDSGIDEPDGHQPYVFQNGHCIGPIRLREWAKMNGESNRDALKLVIPEMPPAEYEACLLDVTDMNRLTWTNTFTRNESCRTGFLTPGGELVLRLER